VIDLLLTVRDFGEEQGMQKALELLGYEAMGAYGIEGRRFFLKGGDQRTHHLHVFVEGDPHVLRHLAFRDYLVHHPQIATAYGALKRDLARSHPHNIEAYCRGKNPWIKEVEHQAIEWREEQVKARLRPMVAETLPLPSGSAASDLTEDLLPYVGSLDPELRDGMVYPVVGTMIARGALPVTDLKRIARTLIGPGYLAHGLGREEDSSVYRRSFALLLLTEIIKHQAENGILDGETEGQLVEAVTAYVEGERDRRGYDDQCGWAHTIAHSGDAIAALAGLETTDERISERLLEAIALHFSDEKRVMINEESERIVTGIQRLREKGHLDQEQLKSWLDGLASVTDELPYPQKQYREENLKRLLSSLYFRLDAEDDRWLREQIESVLRGRSHFQE
jgi:hypothetical protein